MHRQSFLWRLGRDRDAVLLHPDRRRIFNYCPAISDATSLPIPLYNNPASTNVDMSAKLVARLTQAFDNIRYIKQASEEVGCVYDVIEAT
jgi:4-hydroxy-tetrahydrodipicolinate synthase